MNQPIEVDKRVCEEREQRAGLATHKAGVCGRKGAVSEKASCF